MALSNLLKCWLCDNVNLNLVWISRVLGARRQCMMVFSKKILNKTSMKRLIFYKVGTFLQLKWENLLVKDVQNRERTAQAKPLAAIGELQFDYVGRKNDRSNKKTYFNSWYTWPHYEKYCIRCLFCWLTVCIQKINEINQFHMEIFLFKESCNMIG